MARWRSEWNPLKLKVHGGMALAPNSRAVPYEKINMLLSRWRMLVKVRWGRRSILDKRLRIGGSGKSGSVEKYWSQNRKETPAEISWLLHGRNLKSSMSAVSRFRLFKNSAQDTLATLLPVCSILNLPNLKILQVSTWVSFSFRRTSSQPQIHVSLSSNFSKEFVIPLCYTKSHLLSCP